MFRFSLFLAPFVVSATVALGQFAPSGDDAPASQVKWVSEQKTIAPGSTFSTALVLSHPEGWHSYYRNSGGVESPPAIEWSLPDGFSAGPIQWPVPTVKDGVFGKSFVHEGEPAFLIDITAPRDLEVGKTVTLTGHATWQICEEGCINEESKLELTISTGSATVADDAAKEVFANARARLPESPAGWKFSARPDGDDILLRVEPDGPMGEDPVDFVPDQPFVQSVSSGGEIGREGNAWLIRLKRATKSPLDEDIPQGPAFSGILTGNRAILVPETPILDPAATPAGQEKPPSIAKFLPILGGMLLGGLILNLMPCVFPVIGLKIMGFVQQSGSDRRKIALHGLAFTVGVLASFAVLSSILFAARESIGWGYQLQNPWVVFVLMLLMFVLALNMYGVFEIGASATSVGGSLQSKQGLEGSFFSGVLATVVATPCSGPFLGAAIGAAIHLPAVWFFVAFGAMAIGLSLPYLVLSLFPRLIESLPRPGPWMESFKQAMSFLLFATAGYLLWVYAGLIDLENLLGPVFGLCMIAVAGWIHGRWNLPHRAASTRWKAATAAVVFAVGGVLIGLPPKPSKLDWQPWSADKEAALLEAGKPVYVDFTAQWCATCQVNKKRAYTSEVIALMNRKGVVTLKADKTKPNPEIEIALKKLGRTAIPVNVLHVPGKEPVVFPEFLSPRHLIDAIGEIGE